MLASTIPDSYLSVFERLSETLSNALGNRNYGALDEVTFITVAIDETLEENEDRASTITNFTRYTHPFTKQRFRALFIALPFARPNFASMDERAMFEAVCDSAIVFVRASALKAPKDVEYTRLRMDLVKAIQAQKNAALAEKFFKDH